MQTTQDCVTLDKIRDGSVVLKDGSLRVVLIASSLNFALKSAEEQDAIIFQFQNFLNSLEFPIQIYIQSRKLDIRPYIALLENQLENASNDLMQIQIREYIDFVKKFVDMSNIMTKNFFIVVPYARSVIQSKDNFLYKVLGKKQTSKKKQTYIEEDLS